MATVATQTKTNEVMITPQNQLQVVKQWGEAFNNLVTTQNVQLTQNEREFGMSIITNLTNRCIQSGIKANELNMTDFLEQVKHCSKLQLSINEQELYLDIRNNKETGLKTVKISRQYQGIQKLMTRYCKKKIVRFKDGIVCTGDVFEVEDDFNLGLTVIRKHIKNNNIDRNKFENVQKAYAIAYVEEYGKLVPYTVIIDKNRIVRARNAATTDKVWISDSSKMISKTAYWSLWAFMKPYIELPIGLQESFVATDDEMDWDNNVPPDIDTTKVYDINPEEPTETVVEDTIVVEPAEEKKSEENTQTEIQEENDPDIQVISYYTYYNNKEKYQKVNYEDGRDGYQVSEDGKKTIRVRVKK